MSLKIWLSELRSAVEVGLQHYKRIRAMRQRRHDLEDPFTAQDAGR